MVRGRFALGGIILGALLWAGCGGSENTAPILEEPTSPNVTVVPSSPPPPPGNPTGLDGGKSDSGTPVVDAGNNDAGTRGDGGTPNDDGGVNVADAGTDAGLPPTQFPTSAGWNFYGPQHGLPAHVYGVTADEGGNIWAAGGQDGLFLLRPGATSFEQFTMADGLRPYGFMPDGGDAPGPHYLKVISVEGGPAGTVFVGYEGKPPGPGQRGCEDNWDTPQEEGTPDPSIYKSGDADRVTLTGSGISVVHYDIFSGPGMVPPEPQGREKLCTIFRLQWDKAGNRIWFGGNHGFAMGQANYTGSNTCNGNYSCSGLMEHIHPAINAWADDAKSGGPVLLTADYRGIAIDPLTHDVFFGGANRSTRCTWGTHGGLSNAEGGYWGCQDDTEGNLAFKWDIWPDPVSDYSTPSTRKDDLVMGAATTGDGTFWVGSAAWGLAHVSAAGAPLGYLSSELISSNVSGVAADPLDDSIWAGARWGGGVSRVKSGAVVKYGLDVFGNALANNPVTDVQAMGSGSARKILVSWDADGNRPGAVGVYSGN